MDYVLSKEERQYILKAAKQIPAINRRGDLDRRYSDCEDFIETSVWSLEMALTEAFLAGKGLLKVDGGYENVQK